MTYFLASIKFIHLLSLAVWIGSIVFFSFIAAPTTFKALPRETAGDVVGKIFPQYYKLGCLCSILALGSLPLISPLKPGRMTCLILMAVGTFSAAFVIGPKVSALKKSLRKGGSDLEKKKHRFSKLHGLSMGLNMFILAAGLVLLFLTALEFPG